MKQDNIYLIFIIISLYIIIYILSKYKNTIKISLQKKTLNTDEFLKYLDKFFIKNIYYTIFCVLSYIIINIGIVIYLRVKGFNHDISLLIVNNNTINLIALLNIIFYVLLLLFILILFKVLLDILFFDEIIKLHIYLKKLSLYNKLVSHIIIQSPINNFYGKCYLFFHNITKLKVLSDLIDINNYQPMNEFDYIYENQKIQRLSAFFIELIKKCYILIIIFHLFRIIFKFLYTHMTFDGLAPKIPYIIFIIIIIYDIIHLKIYYASYAFYFIYCFNLTIRYMKFIYEKEPMLEGDLYRYFYKNIIDYKKQRKDLFYNNQEYIKYIFKSEENITLFKDIENRSLVNYILTNNFKREKSESEVIIENNMKMMYRRHMFLIISLFILCYTIVKKDILIIIKTWNIIIPISWVLIIIYTMSILTSINAFKLAKDAEMDEIINYIPNRTYNRIFWILAIIQAYLGWLIMIKANIYFTMDECLWDNFNIQIVKYYSIEEKFQFFYTHLDFYLNIVKIPENHVNLIKLFIEESNIIFLIKEQTTLSEINELIENLLNRYFFKYYEYYTFIENRYKRLIITKSIMDCTSSIINIICIWKFFIMYLDAFYLILNPTSPRMIKLIYNVLKLFSQYK